MNAPPRQVLRKSSAAAGWCFRQAAGGWMVCANSARPRRALLWIVAALFATGCATLPVPTGAPHAAGSAGPAPEEPRPCGGQGLPEGWPSYSAADEALLAPFLACASPADFIELQRTVDMP